MWLASRAASFPWPGAALPHPPRSEPQATLEQQAASALACAGLGSAWTVELLIELLTTACSCHQLLGAMHGEGTPVTALELALCLNELRLEGSIFIAEYWTGEDQSPGMRALQELANWLQFPEHSDVLVVWLLSWCFVCLSVIHGLVRSRDC